MAYHEKSRCDAAMESEFKEWLDKKDVKKCPKCRARTEKDGGCNHMTCQSCRHQWCWLCGSTYYKAHYEWWNPIGCMGGQHHERSKCYVITLTIFQFIILPFILLFAPMLGVGCVLPAFCCFDKRPCRRMAVCFKCVGFLLLSPLMLALGAICGGLCLGLLIVPCYIYMIYRVITMFCFHCNCLCR